MNRYKLTISHHVEGTSKFTDLSEKDLIAKLGGPLGALVKQEMSAEDFSLTLTNDQGAIVVRKIPDIKGETINFNTNRT